MLIFGNNVIYQLEKSKWPGVNTIEIRTQHTTSSQKEAIFNVTNQYSPLFSDLLLLIL